jgi:hypothetical protein
VFWGQKNVRAVQCVSIVPYFLTPPSLNPESLAATSNDFIGPAENT